MAEPHFERIIGDRIKGHLEAVLSVQTHDFVRFGELKGRVLGLREALEVFRKGARADADNEGNL